MTISVPPAGAPPASSGVAHPAGGGSLFAAAPAPEPADVAARFGAAPPGFAPAEPAAFVPARGFADGLAAGARVFAEEPVAFEPPVLADDPPDFAAAAPVFEPLAFDPVDFAAEEAAFAPVAFDPVAFDPAAFDPADFPAEEAALERVAFAPEEPAFEPVAFAPLGFDPLDFAAEEAALDPVAFEPVALEPVDFAEEEAAFALLDFAGEDAFDSAARASERDVAPEARDFVPPLAPEAERWRFGAAAAEPESSARAERDEPAPSRALPSRLLERRTGRDRGRLEKTSESSAIG